MKNIRRSPEFARKAELAQNLKKHPAIHRSRNEIGARPVFLNEKYPVIPWNRNRNGARRVFLNEKYPLGPRSRNKNGEWSVFLNKKYRAIPRIRNKDGARSIFLNKKYPAIPSSHNKTGARPTDLIPRNIWRFPELVMKMVLGTYFQIKNIGWFLEVVIKIELFPYL